MKKVLMLIAAALLAFNAQAFLLFGEVNNTYTQTKYPIVLVHGLFGFDNILGADYFYGVPDALWRGGAEVYVPQVSATNSSEVRGEQLLEQIHKILAVTGAKKVNLIGHSHGSPTARYVASIEPDIVASVTSVGGVNRGSELTDLMRETIPEGSMVETAFDKASKGATFIIDMLSGGELHPQSGISALNSLTTEGSNKFNESYPEGIPTTKCGDGDFLAPNGVYYYSWTGSQPFTNALDPLDYGFGLMGLMYKGEKSDGAVGVCVSHLGKVIRDDYKMNHMDEVNQSFGIHGLFETDPVTLYRQHANRLKMQGL